MQIKTVLIGDSGVGKTAIIERFVDNQFNINHRKTIGASFTKHTLHIGTKTVHLSIWDTAIDFLSSFGDAIYHDINSFVLTIDCTKPFDENQIKKWINEAKKKQPHAKWYIAVNKWDNEHPAAKRHPDFKTQSSEFIDTDEEHVKQRLRTTTQGLIELNDHTIFFCSAQDSNSLVTDLKRLFHFIAKHALEVPQKTVSDSEPLKTPEHDIEVPKRTFSDLARELTPPKTPFSWRRFGIAVLRTLFNPRNWLPITLALAIGVCFLSVFPFFAPAALLASVTVGVKIAFAMLFISLIVKSVVETLRMAQKVGLLNRPNQESHATKSTLQSILGIPKYIKNAFMGWLTQSWRNQVQFWVGVALFAAIAIPILIMAFPAFQIALTSALPFTDAIFHAFSTALAFFQAGLFPHQTLFGLLLMLSATVLSAYDVLCRIITTISPVRSAPERISSNVEDMPKGSQRLGSTAVSTQTNSQNSAAYQPVMPIAAKSISVNNLNTGLVPNLPPAPQ